jgi:tetratricopeptide (TPR) repeat protein
MQINQIEDKIRWRRDQAKEAVALATQGRWEEAAERNRALLAYSCDDVEAANRLGKALSELGRYSEARDAFKISIGLSPGSIIAQKNLERLANLKDAPSSRPPGRITPLLFIEERGKSCTTTLRNCTTKEVLAQVAAGDTLSLDVDGATLQVSTHHGDILGQIEPRLATRMIRLLTGGNRYVVAAASIKALEVSVVLREVYQHPQMNGIVSFPSREIEPIPYISVADEELEEPEDAEIAVNRDWEEPEETIVTGRGNRPPKAALAEDIVDEEAM